MPIIRPTRGAYEPPVTTQDHAAQLFQVGGSLLKIVCVGLLGLFKIITQATYESLSSSK